MQQCHRNLLGVSVLGRAARRRCSPAARARLHVALGNAAAGARLALEVAAGWHAAWSRARPPRTRAAPASCRCRRTRAASCASSASASPRASLRAVSRLDLGARAARAARLSRARPAGCPRRRRMRQRTGARARSGAGVDEWVGLRAVSRRRLAAPGRLEGLRARGAAAGEGVPAGRPELRCSIFAQVPGADVEARLRSWRAGSWTRRRAASATGSTAARHAACRRRRPRAAAPLPRGAGALRFRTRARGAPSEPRRTRRCRCGRSPGRAQPSPAGCCCTSTACRPGRASPALRPDRSGGSPPRAAACGCRGALARALLALLRDRPWCWRASTRSTAWPPAPRC